MNWKFWKKQSAPDGSHESKTRLSGPKDLPTPIGMFLVTHQKSDPDWAWSLKCVLRRHPDQKSSYMFRVFNPAETDIHVADYTSLDHHPELILFQGVFDKRTNQVKLEKSAPVTA